MGTRDKLTIQVEADIERAEQRVAAAVSRMNNQQVELDLRSTRKQAEDLRVKLDAANEKLGGIGDAAKKAKPGLSGMANALGRVTGSRILGGLLSLKTGILGITAAVGAAAVAFVRFGRRVTESYMATDRAARMADLTTRQYEGLAFAARATGSSVDALMGTVNRLTRAVGEAAAGNARFRRAMEELGVSFHELEAMDPSTRLQVVAHALAQMESDAARARVANRLLGDGYRELLPALNDTRNGLSSLIAEGERNATQSQRQTEAAREHTAELARHRAEIDKLLDAHQELAANIGMAWDRQVAQAKFKSLAFIQQHMDAVEAIRRRGVFAGPGALREEQDTIRAERNAPRLTDATLQTLGFDQAVERLQTTLDTLETSGMDADGARRYVDNWVEEFDRLVTHATEAHDAVWRDRVRDDAAGRIREAGEGVLRSRREATEEAARAEEQAAADREAELQRRAKAEEEIRGVIDDRIKTLQRELDLLDDLSRKRSLTPEEAERRERLTQNMAGERAAAVGIDREMAEEELRRMDMDRRIFEARRTAQRQLDAETARAAEERQREEDRTAAERSRERARQEQEIERAREQVRRAAQQRERTHEQAVARLRESIARGMTRSLSGGNPTTAGGDINATTGGRVEVSMQGQLRELQRVSKSTEKAAANSEEIVRAIDALAQAVGRMGMGGVPRLG